VQHSIIIKILSTIGSTLTGADIHHIKYAVMNVISVTTSLSTFLAHTVQIASMLNFI